MVGVSFTVMSFIEVSIIYRVLIIGGAYFKGYITGVSITGVLIKGVFIFGPL